MIEEIFKGRGSVKEIWLKFQKDESRIIDKGKWLEEREGRRGKFEKEFWNLQKQKQRKKKILIKLQFIF